MSQLLESEAPRQTAVTQLCRNCGRQLAGRYCSGCGQEAVEEGPSTFSILREWFEDSFSADSRVARTAAELLLQPGAVALAHREGRRASYLRPVQTYSVLSASFFALFLLTRPIDSAYYHLRPGDLSSYANSMARVVLLLVPIMAVTLKVLIRPTRLLAEHLVFALYTGAAGFAGMIVMLACSSLWKWWWGSVFTSPFDVLWLVYAPGWLALLAYLVIALRRAYRLAAWKALLDMFIVILVTVTAFLGLTVVVSRL